MATTNLFCLIMLLSSAWLLHDRFNLGAVMFALAAGIHAGFLGAELRRRDNACVRNHDPLAEKPAEDPK